MSWAVAGLCFLGGVLTSVQMAALPGHAPWWATAGGLVGAALVGLLFGWLYERIDRPKPKRRPSVLDNLR